MAYMDAMIRADDHKVAVRGTQSVRHTMPALAGSRLMSVCWMLFMLLALHWAMPFGQPAGPSSVAVAGDCGNGLAAGEHTGKPAIQPRLRAVSALAEVRLFAGKREHSTDDHSPSGLAVATPRHGEPVATLQRIAGRNASSLTARAQAYEARAPPLPA
ncbi:MAG: hypothetical protein J0I57_12325 [Hyphomicrobium sp.]|nr:hypothetical protein [Hyphomicrobium sp.]